MTDKTYSFILFAALGFTASRLVTSTTKAHLEIYQIHVHHWIWSLPVSLIALTFGYTEVAGFFAGVTIDDFTYPQTIEDLKQGNI